MLFLVFLYVYLLLYTYIYLYVAQNKTNNVLIFDYFDVSIIHYCFHCLLMMIIDETLLSEKRLQLS